MAGCDDDTGCIRRENLAGAAGARHNFRAPHLDQFTGQRQGCAGEGVEGADFARQNIGGLVPIEMRFGFADFCGIGHAAGRLRHGNQRIALRQGFDDQDFLQDYSQGPSHYGSQGFGAQGSQGVYGPQGFGAQGGIGARQEYGSSGAGGYSREGYGARQYAQHSQAQQGSSGQWRASDVTGQGQSMGSGHRGKCPKNYMRSDERIREDLNERLTDSDEIDASSITVEVSNGVATLNGTVDQRWMKHRAEDIADGCSGVRDVNNQIKVTSSSQQSGQHAGSAGQSASGTSTQTGGNPGSGSASTISGSGASSTSGASTSGSQAAGSNTSAPGMSTGATSAASSPGGGASGLGSRGPGQPSAQSGSDASSAGASQGSRSSSSGSTST